MKSLYVLLALAAWIVCGIFTTGILLARDQALRSEALRTEHFREDLGEALFWGLLGPLGLLAALTSSGLAQYGLQYRRRKP